MHHENEIENLWGGAVVKKKVLEIPPRNCPQICALLGVC